jgi:hypothetical protein
VYYLARGRQLPTWGDLTDNLIPLLENMRAEYLNTAGQMRAELEATLTAWMKNLTSETTNQLARSISEMMSNLRARDLSPWKLRLKWMGLGAVFSSMLFIWLRLFQIW